MIVLCCIVNVTGISIIYRYSYYFWLFYFVMFSEALFRYTVDHNNGKKFLIYNVKNDRIWIFVYIIFIFYKTHQYFVPDGGSRYIMSYSRFYPYSSIIDKQLDPDRERIYRYYSLEQ